MTSQSLSWRHQVRHDVTKCVMASKTYHDVKRFVMTSQVCHEVNKRPLGLIAPLSNNTLSMIYSPLTLIWPFNATQGQMSWCKLKDHIYCMIYCVFMKNVYDAPFRRYNLLKSCDLYSTLKVNPMSNVLR